MHFCSHSLPFTLWNPTTLCKKFCATEATKMNCSPTSPSMIKSNQVDFIMKDFSYKNSHLPRG